MNSDAWETWSRRPDYFYGERVECCDHMCSHESTQYHFVSWAVTVSPSWLPVVLSSKPLPSTIILPLYAMTEEKKEMIYKNDVNVIKYSNLITALKYVFFYIKKCFTVSTSSIQRLLYGGSVVSAEITFQNNGTDCTSLLHKLAEQANTDHKCSELPDYHISSIASARCLFFFIWLETVRTIQGREEIEGTAYSTVHELSIKARPAFI